MLELDELIDDSVCEAGMDAERVRYLEADDVIRLAWKTVAVVFVGCRESLSKTTDLDEVDVV